MNLTPILRTLPNYKVLANKEIMNLIKKDIFNIQKDIQDSNHEEGFLKIKTFIELSMNRDMSLN